MNFLDPQIGNSEGDSILESLIIKDINKEDFIESLNNQTRINAIDCLSGILKFDENNLPLIDSGIPPRLISLIGQSGVGKTTLALLIGASIVEHNLGSKFYMFDLEDNTPSHSRFMKLTDWNNDQFIKKYMYYKVGTSVVEIYNVIRKIADMKEKNKKAFTYSTEFIDIFGKKIEKYVPSFVLLDSLAAITPSGMEELTYNKSGEVKDKAELYNNIDGMTVARTIKNFVDKIKPFLNKYNIILMCINHETDSPDISAGPFSIKQKFHPNMTAGKKMKGGNEIIYQSYMLMDVKVKEKIDPKYDATYGPDIRGIVTELKYIKNKSSVSGIPIRLVFDYEKGYLPDLSDFEYLFQAKYGFSGGPSAYKLDVYPEITFNRKNLYKTVRENLMFARALYFTARQKMLYDIILKKETPNLEDIVNNTPKDYRYALIWSYSSYYPFYTNFNLSNEEYKALIKYADIIPNFNKNNLSYYNPGDYDWNIDPEDNKEFDLINTVELSLNDKEIDGFIYSEEDT